MTPKIENRSYNYQGDNVCNVSATLNIYGPDGVTIVVSTGISASYNIAEPDFLVEINRQLTEQVMAYLGKLQELEQMRLAILPASTSFADAVDMIFDPIQTAIGG